MKRIPLAIVLFVVFPGLTACGGDDSEAGASGAVHSLPAMPDKKANRAPGTQSAPITIDYEIMGLPVVGIPLSINVMVRAEVDEPITVNYRIIDSTSLMFTESQSERVSLVPAGEEGFSAEQVTVIPQREGRLFLNVSAEIDTEGGMMARVMAIPIQVGSQRPVPRKNGDLTGGAAGEAPISMPLQEE